MRLALCIAVLCSLSAAQDAICQQRSPCETDCYATCDNPCDCALTADGAVPSPVYGGSCKETGFCESQFQSLEECIGQGGPSCPRKIVEIEEVLSNFTKYDFRFDVRSQGEWDEGHAQISVFLPGLALNPAKNYLDRIEGKEDANVLVYCRSGRRAFAASQNLLRYGFKNVDSYYPGGFPDLQAKVEETSEQDTENYPSKNWCYITGRSDICPTPLPRSYVSTADDILSLGDNVKLVDVRPRSYKQSIKGAARVPANKKQAMKKFLKKVKEDVETLVVFCEIGDLAFEGAKAIIKLGWEGPIYFFDNGGYKDLKKLF
ncbi:hypothetical protein ACHWQZ_G006988 [Mnemiopsis leidyi]